MVGGTVLQVCTLPNRNDVLWIEVGDRPYKKIERCGVLVERTTESEEIEINDGLWWQSGRIMWTPRNPLNARYGQEDVVFRKIGGSGVTYESASQTEKVGE